MIHLWPNALPARVLREGWSVRPVSPLRRTEMDDGAIAVTRRFARVRTVLPVRWEMTADQFEVFKDFWLRDLGAGQAWFDAPVFLGFAAVVKRVRFASADPVWTAESPAPGIVFVAAELEMSDMPALTDAERAAFEANLILFGGADAVAAEIAAANARLVQIDGVP